MQNMVLKHLSFFIFLFVFLVGDIKRELANSKRRVSDFLKKQEKSKRQKTFYDAEILHSKIETDLSQILGQLLSGYKSFLSKI